MSKQHHFIVYAVEGKDGTIVWNLEQHLGGFFPDGPLYDPLSDSMEGWSVITDLEDEERDARICEDLCKRLLPNTGDPS